MLQKMNRRAELTETTVKSLLCCRFRRTGKEMGQVYQCWWRICQKINVFFPRFEYHMFLRFISIRDLQAAKVDTLLTYTPCHDT
jgi:hypothetical protein